jgi:transposase-like protein
MFENTNGNVKEAMPNTEVVVKAKRKRFSAAEKLRILREVEACRGSGEIGALMRREGIYSSYLTTWRKQRELGELDGLSPHKRGPKPNPEAIELAKLRREHERLQERMRRAELIIDVQKKVARMLGETIESPELDDPS